MYRGHGDPKTRDAGETNSYLPLARSSRVITKLVFQIKRRQCGVHLWHPAVHTDELSRLQYLARIRRHGVWHGRQIITSRVAEDKHTTHTERCYAGARE